MRSQKGLNYQLEGPTGAPVLVLSHSIGTDAGMWEPQLAAFAQDFRVLTYDTRGHGRSETPEPPYSLAELGADVLGLLDELGIARAHFCGLSLGGITGLWLGIHAPDRLSALVVANAAPRIATSEVWGARIAQVAAEGMGAVAQASPSRWFTPSFLALRPKTAERVQAIVARTAPAGYAGCCAALRDADLWGALASIRTPTLLVAGMFDSVTTTLDARAMAARIAGATLAELPASHLSNIEAAGEFNRVVGEFLALRAQPFGAQPDSPISR